MTIVKDGSLKLAAERPIYELECPNCGCQFQIASSDITRQERSPAGRKWTKCPHKEKIKGKIQSCGKEIEITAENRLRAK